MQVNAVLEKLTVLAPECNILNIDISKTLLKENYKKKKKKKKKNRYIEGLGPDGVVRQCKGAHQYSFWVSYRFALGRISTCCTCSRY